MSDDRRPAAGAGGLPAFLINFAYGSNMCSRRLQQRVPSARALGPGTLAGHRLAWHKKGRDGSAKCDLVETGDPADQAWGVLFVIASAEKPALDRAEGLGHGYLEKTVQIASAGTAVPAFVYCATDIDTTLRPFDWYRALVLAGAREHGLPLSCVRGIQAVAAVADADIERARRHFALARPF